MADNDIVDAQQHHCTLYRSGVSIHQPTAVQPSSLRVIFGCYYAGVEPRKSLAQRCVVKKFDVGHTGCMQQSYICLQLLRLSSCEPTKQVTAHFGLN
jgi:hypothetical protein